MTIKKFLLLLIIVPLVFSIQSCGKGAGEGYTSPGLGQGSPVYIKLKPSRYAAQTNGCIEFYAEVHDAQGELLANIPVTFTNLSEPFGQLLDRCGGTEINPPVVINTDSMGRARVTLYSTTPGFASVLAQTYIGEQQVVVNVDGMGETFGGFKKTVHAQMMGAKADHGLKETGVYLQGLVKMLDG